MIRYLRHDWLFLQLRCNCGGRPFLQLRYNCGGRPFLQLVIANRDVVHMRDRATYEEKRIAGDVFHIAIMHPVIAQ